MQPSKSCCTLAAQPALREPQASKGKLSQRRQRLIAPARRRRRAAIRAQGLEWGDIVVYDSPGGAPALGRVVSAAGATEVTVERLEEDAVNLVWLVAHEAEQRVPASGVRRTVQADYLQLVDPDRVSNPHGEHAIEAYRLLEPLAGALDAAGRAQEGP